MGKWFKNLNVEPCNHCFVFLQTAFNYNFGIFAVSFIHLRLVVSPFDISNLLYKIEAN